MTKVPKGKLIPIGGKEARSPENERHSGDTQSVDFDEGGILQEVLSEMKGPDSRIEIITTASEEPDEMGEMYVEAFGKLGCHQVHVLNLDGRNIDSRKSHDALASADGVFLTGGNQDRLIEKMGGSRFLEKLKERYLNDEFVIAGTSAGAMAMAGVTIKEGPGTESLLKGIVELEKGFNLLPNTIVDTHFMSRGRFSRLAEALLICPGYTALGICEDTGLVISQGNFLKTIGSGVVMVLDADGIKKTNFKEAKKRQPIFVEGMSMHILAEGIAYSLQNRKCVLQGTLYSEASDGIGK